MTPLLSDLRLARQASDGDERAFAAIYKRYHQDIYRFCLSILGRPEDAQDALQNTMVKALRSLPGERREIKLKPWLYRVAHNESIDLLRRRREGVELDEAQASSGPGLAETVAQRQRLGRLLADLGELPERQRSALVMRELGDLDYEQIGAAFESSAAVARQTVYEARLALRELETGREMSCEQVTRQLSDADGRVMRRRGIRAHLRACPECRAFRDSIEDRSRDLQALAPLPAVAAASILHGLVGGNAGAAGGLGGAATAAGAGAGKAAGTSLAVKALATAAIVATVGVTAADRSGLIDAGLPGGGGSSKSAPASSGGSTGTSSRNTSGSTTVNQGGSVAGSRSQHGHMAVKPADRAEAGRDSSSPSSPAPVTTPADAAGNGSGAHGNGRTRQPEAAHHGQETAAAHKATGRGKSKGHSTHPAHPSPPPNSKGAAKSEDAKSKGKNKGQEVQPEEPAKTPPSEGTESPAQAKGEARAETGAENGKAKTDESSEPSS